MSLLDIENERDRQRERYGELPNGTGEFTYVKLAKLARRAAGESTFLGNLTWAEVLEESVYDALAREKPTKLRDGLVQIAAICVAWMESLDASK